ncbi:MAG: glycosyltransferase family 2 protein [Chloroflexota bacterium]|nr:glycosyltransferase family 2 protein [Chloroflexota bacterium]MDE2948303.1 glycosyltransferase family 2 protein [Chloroflexota bacterium]
MTAPEDAPRTDLAVVIVTWNNAEIIADALRSLLEDLAGSGLRCEVWLADSASDDHTVEIVRRDFDNVILLENETNIGFGAANNQALRQLGFANAARREKPTAVYLLNPDTVTQPGATRLLYDTLLSRSKIGVVGARLTFADGSFQHSAFRFPGLRQLWAELFPTPGRLIEGGFNGRYPRTLYAGALPFDVDFTLGATMMLRREAIEKTGLFDEDFFIYCEEVDWAWRIRKHGWRILCVPRAHVTHLGGGSTSQARPSSLIHLWKSRLLLYEKHFPAWKRQLARQLVILGMRRKMRNLKAEEAELRAACRAIIEMAEA